MIPDLPGWDSLPTVTRYHGWAEMVGIAFLSLLVVAEVVTYKYGHRKDDLTEQQQDATNQRHDEEMARLHLETAKVQERAAQLEKEAAQARADTERLKQLVQWRTIDAAAFGRLIAGLSGPKGTVKLAYQAADPEALALSIQISKAFEQSGGWTLSPESRTYPSALYFGLFIPGPENDLVNELRNAFTAANIPFSTQEIPPPPNVFRKSGTSGCHYFCRL